MIANNKGEFIMIKTVLIGLGRIGWQFHLPQLQSHPEFALTAVVDPALERLEEAKTLTGANGYTDYRDMLANEQPQLAVIASPTMFHEEQAVACLQAGMDVLLDKPMSYDLASAKRIAETAERLGRKLTVYQPHRFTAAAVLAKRVIDSGKLGALVELKSANCQYVRRNDWQAFKKHGGGMLNNYGAHYIDQLLFLSGERVKHLSSKLRNVAGMGDAEDMVRVMMETESGTVLDVTINQASAIPFSPLTVLGERGGMQLRTNASGNPEFYVKYYLPKELSERKVDDGLAAPDRKYPSEVIPWHEEIIPVRNEAAADYYAQCAAYFGGDAKPPVAVSDTLYVMELMAECRAQNA